MTSQAAVRFTKRSTRPAPKRNAEADWQAFDPESYFQHYYGDPHPDDDALTFLAANALRLARGESPRGLDVVDVGTGPSLIPLLAALPAATKLTAWEYAEPNLAWLAQEIAAHKLRPQWSHFWQTARTAWSHEAASSCPLLPHDPLPMLIERTRLVRNSIFDLPRHAFDAATMFFCAESITSSRSEFDLALSAFVGTVRPGGHIAAAFLAGSSGYEVSGRRFPAVSLASGEIRARLARRLASLQVVPIGLSTHEVRSGYTGAIFVSGRTPS